MEVRYRRYGRMRTTSRFNGRDASGAVAVVDMVLSIVVEQMLRSWRNESWIVALLDKGESVGSGSIRETEYQPKRVLPDPLPGHAIVPIPKSKNRRRGIQVVE